ncbi:hypothetical protein RJT34_08909 [Clitoria ternatea]|uniref:Uncharacterized protein n=1 Tax=Clitoria ternatea TaxID=43366 RepID=A0AAN9K765_CLITE
MKHDVAISHWFPSIQSGRCKHTISQSHNPLLLLLLLLLPTPPPPQPERESITLSNVTECVAFPSHSLSPLFISKN